MAVKRNRVLELLKERSAAIQQATFLMQNGSDGPPEIATAPMEPWDDVQHYEHLSIADDPHVSDSEFYAAVDKDIKEHGYFKGDRQYGKGQLSNESFFDATFGPDKPHSAPLDKEMVDVMPTATSKTETRVGGLWQIPDDLVDPRDDFQKDTGYWTQLLRLLFQVDGNDPAGLFGLLYGLRCEGSIGLEPNPKGGVKVFARNEFVWQKARAEVMAKRDWAINLNAMLGQVVP